MKTLLRITLVLAAGMSVSLANAAPFELDDSFRTVQLMNEEGNNSPSYAPGLFVDHVYFTPEANRPDQMSVHAWQESDINAASGSMSGQSGFSFGPNYVLPGYDTDEFFASSGFLAGFSLLSAAEYTLSLNYDATLIPGNRDEAHIQMAIYKVEDGSSSSVIYEDFQILDTGNESLSWAGTLDPGVYGFSLYGDFRTNRYSSSFSQPPGGDMSYDFQFNVAAVPEPETWTLLLAGLGLMGLFARRRMAA